MYVDLIVSPFKTFIYIYIKFSIHQKWNSSTNTKHDNYPSIIISSASVYMNGMLVEHMYVGHIAHSIRDINYRSIRVIRLMYGGLDTHTDGRLSEVVGRGFVSCIV